MHDSGQVRLADGLHRCLDAGLQVEVAGLTDAELLEATVDLYAAQARLDALKARVLGEVDARGTYGLDGARTASEWLQHRGDLPAGVARGDVLVARSLRALPSTAGLLADGEITVHHAARIARHHRNPRLTEALEAAEAMLAAEAARLPFSLFVKVLEYWVQLADPDGTDDDAEARRARRRLHLSRTLDGSWKLDGLLDPVAGTILDAAIRRVADELYRADRAEATARLGREPVTGDLARSPQQRRADALVELAQRGCTAPRSGKRPDPLVSVLVDHDTFAGRMCELADGTVITPGDAAALLDRALIERVVYDGPSRIIDLGQQRYFVGAARRILELRDRTCTHELCDAPGWRCDGDHHPLGHAAGGRTNQDGGRLRCPFHHHLPERRSDRRSDQRRRPPPPERP